MGRVYEAQLSRKGINGAMKWLREYRDKRLPDMVKEFSRRLGEEGVTVAQHHIKGSTYEPFVVFETKIAGNKVQRLVIVSGRNIERVVREWYTTAREDAEPKYAEVSPILMAEYGSGLYTDPASWRGTFPGQTHANSGNYWYWYSFPDWDYDKEAERVKGFESDEGLVKWRSRGTKPYAPMTWADSAVKKIEFIRRTAIDVFGE